ncbi:MAG: hypothetical protein MOB07_05820 [Acidobacteria bacterium]|nr:hypothetical protein [Acidobacteriota bacterium]
MSTNQPGAAKPARKNKKMGAAPPVVESENMNEQSQRADQLTEDIVPGHSQPEDQSFTEEAAPLMKKHQFERHWSDWDELANFFVSFGYEITREGEKQLQTRTIHYEGVEERKWKEIATTELLAWMMSRANPSLPPESIEQFETQSSLDETPTLELSDLTIFQVKMPAFSASMEYLSGMLRVNGTMVVSERVSGDLNFMTDFHLVDTQSNRWMRVASQLVQLASDDLTYEIEQDFPLPPVGHYQLYVTARQLPTGNLTIWVEGPLIHVEA